MLRTAIMSVPFLPLLKPKHGSPEYVMVGDRLDKLESQSAVQVMKTLYTWGKGEDGQLGQTDFGFPKGCCALPRPVLSRKCGACGLRGRRAWLYCSGNVAGELYTFGNNYLGRLGHPAGEMTERSFHATSSRIAVSCSCHTCRMWSGPHVMS